LSHAQFAALALSGGTATLRLQPFSSLGEADLSDATLCPDRTWTFTDPNAPRVTWQRVQQGGVDIVDFTTSFLTTDEFEITMQFDDASGDLAQAALIGRLGSTAKTLWAELLPASGRETRNTKFTLDEEGEWRIFCIVKDASGRTTEQELTPVGGGAAVTLIIGVGTCAIPVPTLHFGGAITLSCSTPGATILYQIVDLYAPPGGTWLTYASPLWVFNATLYLKAQAAGLTDSAVVSYDFPD